MSVPEGSGAEQVAAPDGGRITVFRDILSHQRPPRVSLCVRRGSRTERRNLGRLTTMTDFMKWLRVELLRLRSFDWGPGSRRIHRLKDGVVKFSSVYPTSDLAAKIGTSEDELLKLLDSPSVITELGDKSFTLAWKEGYITLSWLEEGISEWKTEIDQRFSEEDGKYYSEFRLTDKVVYLDGTERVIKDTGEPKRVSITEEAFKDAVARICPSNDNW